MYKVSVIIPVYNGEKYVETCIQSILNQTLKEIEIIIVNDGSKDNTLNILRKLENKYENIIVINQQNLGPGIARNKAMNIANGKYIAFCDVDDTYEEKMLEKLYLSADINNCEVSVCGYKNIEGDIYTVYLPEFDSGTVLENNDIKTLILKNIIKNGGGIYASSCNKIYLKECIDGNNIKFGEERIYGEDWFFNQKILGRIKKITFIKESLYNYNRINENSIMKSFHTNLFDLHIDSRNFLRERMKEWNLYNEENIKNFDNRFCIKVFESIINEMSSKNKKSTIKKILYVKTIVNNYEVIQASKNSNKNFINKLIENKKYILLSMLGVYQGEIKVKLNLIKSKIINIVR